MAALQACVTEMLVFVLAQFRLLEVALKMRMTVAVSGATGVCVHPTANSADITLSLMLPSTEVRNVRRHQALWKHNHAIVVRAVLFPNPPAKMEPSLYSGVAVVYVFPTSEANFARFNSMRATKS